jgi:HK97 family phage portal protein
MGMLARISFPQIKTMEEYRAEKLEKRSTSLDNPAKWLVDLIGGQRSATGVTVGDDGALANPGFWNGVISLANPVGTLSKDVRRRLPDGGSEVAYDHPLQPLIHDCPSPLISSASFWTTAMMHLLLRGDFYAVIDWGDDGHARELILLQPDQVSRKGDYYEVRLRSNGRELIPAENMLHIAGPSKNGIDGLSVVALHREAIGLAIGLQQSQAHFLGNASRPSGILSTKEAMKAETLTTLKAQWNKANSGLDKQGGTVVLDGGFEWTPVSLSAEDQQYMQSREFSLQDMARLLNVPPHKVGDHSRSTFSNLESMQRQFVQDSLRPWLVRIEQALNLRLFTPRERTQGYFIEFNVDSLLRADTVARSEHIRTLFASGAITVNEIRKLERLGPPLPNGDQSFVQLGFAPLDAAVSMPMAERHERLEVEKRGYALPAIERRSHTERVNLRDQFRPMFLEVTERMVRGEVRNVRRLLKQSDGLRSRIADYYLDDHAPFVLKTVGSLFQTYAVAVVTPATGEVGGDPFDPTTFTDEYTDTFATRASAESRRKLQDMEPEEIEAQLDTWLNGDSQVKPKAERIAQRELVQLNNAVAMTVFAAAGVTTLKWKTVGDSCPWCRALDGVTVGTGLPFVSAGEGFEPEGADRPLAPSSNIRTPPLHGGCNCVIVPVIL